MNLSADRFIVSAVINCASDFNHDKAQCCDGIDCSIDVDTVIFYPGEEHFFL